MAESAVSPATWPSRVPGSAARASTGFPPSRTTWPGWPGVRRTGLLARLRRRLDEVNGRGACRHPDGAVTLVRSALGVFAADVAAHDGGAVPALAPAAAAVPRPTGGRDELRIPIDPVACDAYGFCAELLPEAITLDEWGYPIAEEGLLPDGVLGLGQAGGSGLPKRAITVRQKKGS